jgi:hypothetical protein
MGATIWRWRFWSVSRRTAASSKRKIARGGQHRLFHAGDLQAQVVGQHVVQRRDPVNLGRHLAGASLRSRFKMSATFFDHRRGSMPCSSL